MDFFMATSTLMVVAATLNTVGDLLVIWVVLRVHSHVAREHSIDADVIAAIRRERTLVGIGITMIVLGYILEFAAYTVGA